MITDANQNNNLYYICKDHLGSITALVNQSGTIEEEYNYDAWGRRRNPSNWSYTLTTPALITRGYTTHEHLDDFGLINMNGRLYDPIVGRMLSPDIIVQDAMSTQFYNRYSYCINNPLKYTDPSGYTLGNWFQKIKDFFNNTFFGHEHHKKTKRNNHERKFSPDTKEPALDGLSGPGEGSGGGGGGLLHEPSPMDLMNTPLGAYAPTQQEDGVYIDMGKPVPVWANKGYRAMVAPAVIYEVVNGVRSEENLYEGSMVTSYASYYLSNVPDNNNRNQLHKSQYQLAYQADLSNGWACLLIDKGSETKGGNILLHGAWYASNYSGCWGFTTKSVNANNQGLIMLDFEEMNEIVRKLQEYMQQGKSIYLIH